MARQLAGRRMVDVMPGAVHNDAANYTCAPQTPTSGYSPHSGKLRMARLGWLCLSHMTEVRQKEAGKNLHVCRRASPPRSSLRYAVPSSWRGSQQ
jgi:hypothetical protein